MTGFGPWGYFSSEFARGDDGGLGVGKPDRTHFRRFSNDSPVRGLGEEVRINGQHRPKSRKAI